MILVLGLNWTMEIYIVIIVVGENILYEQLPVIEGVFVKEYLIRKGELHVGIVLWILLA